MKKYSIIRLLFVVVLCMNCVNIIAHTDDDNDIIVKAKVGKALPLWREGFLDIHMINSGRGECSFFILPDGTTMLVDAGEFVEKPKDQEKHALVDQKPNVKTRPYVTYTKYIKHFMKNTHRRVLDYMLLTHFHMDHMGDYNASFKYGKGNYMLSGVTAVYDVIPFRTIIDRAFPNYESSRLEDTSKKLDQYESFISYATKNKGLVAEKFALGSDNQIRLKHDPDKYRSFKIKNICVNGHVWNNGKDVYCFSGKKLRENSSSEGFLLSYGDFDYWTAGDASNINIEKEYAKAIGRKIEACKSNHHMSWNTMCKDMIDVLDPDVIASQQFYEHQPHMPVLDELLSSNRDNGMRKIFFTNFNESLLENMEYKNIINKVAGMRGHIVLRVLPGGKSYYVYMLDDSDFKYRVKMISGPFYCK